MESFNVKSSSRSEMVNITREVEMIVRDNNFKDGLVTVFIPHTTAAVTINENADPSVCRDFLKKLDRTIPEGESFYTHMEGNSDSHLKCSIIGASETIIVENGQLQLGTWQGIYFCEFDGPRTRKVWVKLV